MKRAPLIEKSNKPNSITSHISLRASTDSLSIIFYTDNLQSTLTHFKQTESNYCTKPTTNAKRMQLVDWLINVHAKLAFVDETLFLAINIVDRVLSARNMGNDKMALLGVSSLFLAAKYEEVVPPCLETFAVLLERRSNEKTEQVKESLECEEDIKKAEKYILYLLNYKMDYPSPLNFLRHVSKCDNYDERTRRVAKYLLEYGLLFDEFVSFCGSVKAVTCFYLARLVCNLGGRDEIFWYYADVNRKDVDE
ncbi:G2/mitotic-specific cyclin, partial [Conglomerata obtusa]